VLDSGRPCLRAAKESTIPARRAQRASRAATPSRRKPAPARRRPAARRPAGAKGRPRASAAAHDAALDRTGDSQAVPTAPSPRRSPRSPAGATREIGWAAFGEIARTLAERIRAAFRPSVVVGVARGGVFVGAALATALGAEFFPVRIERRRRDAGQLPHTIVELPELGGRRVLVVDDVAVSGATLAKARALARKAGAGDVRTAVMVARPGARPDFAALETEDLVVFGWDYQLDAGAGPGGPVDPGEVGV
jgi:hypoxanthine phosphoribosyltransferase